MLTREVLPSLSSHEPMDVSSIFTLARGEVNSIRHVLSMAKNVTSAWRSSEENGIADQPQQQWKAHFMNIQ